MTSYRRALPAMALIFLLACLGNAQWTNAPLQPPSRPNMRLYREDANAVQDISEARLQARKANKRVLLVFGGNWCIDCHVLDNAFHRPRIAPLLDPAFIFVHLDVGLYTKK